LIGAGLVGLVVGFLVVKLLMISGYATTAVLKYEGELDLPGLPLANDAIGPAADALMHQSVLRKIRDETGYEGTLTMLASSIGYRVDYFTGTMEITVGAETGEGAAERVRLVTDVFMHYHKERQSRRIEDEIVRARRRIEAAEREAEETRRRYNAFREEHGIADLSTEQQSIVESAASLQTESELAAAEVRALEAQVQTLEAQLSGIPKTSFVAGSSPEQATYHRLREQLVSARATLSEDHPRVQSLQQQVDQLRSQLGRSPGTAPSADGTVSANTTYQVLDEELRETKARLTALRERQKGLMQMAERARNRVEVFSEIEGEAAGLLASVNVNDNLVGSLRRTEAALQDALRDPPSGFVVLDPGAVPEYPVRNKKKIVVFGTVPMVTFGLALFVVLRREFGGLRVGTPTEVAFWGKGPVLGATPWPEDPQGLDELVASLDDFTPEARGTFLIVSAHANESGLAVQLSDRLNDDWLPTDQQAMPRNVPVPPRSSPLQTPPPGPYPVGGTVGARSTALARLPSPPRSEALRLVHRPSDLRLEAWEGPYEGQALRRAARLADRVIVLVRSGAVSPFDLNAMGNRLGRAGGVGYIVLGLPEELRNLPDRVGDVATFWKA